MYDIYLFTLALICTNVHTLQTCTIIDEQIGQLGRHFIIHHLIDHAYIVVGEEVNRTILSFHRHHIGGQRSCPGGGIASPYIGLCLRRPAEDIQRHTEQTIGFQLR